jgi:hypothetical protein
MKRMHIILCQLSFFIAFSECSFAPINTHQDSVFPLIIKSIVAGALTGASAGIADLRIFPFVGFLTEPVIRRFLLEELFAAQHLTPRQIEIACWFAWISSWIAWYKVQ